MCFDWCKIIPYEFIEINNAYWSLQHLYQLEGQCDSKMNSFMIRLDCNYTFSVDLSSFEFTTFFHKPTQPIDHVRRRFHFDISMHFIYLTIQAFETLARCSFFSAKEWAKQDNAFEF